MKQLEKLSGTAYALLRIIAGFMFLFHGAQKILGILPNPDHPGQPEMFSQMWVGGMIELIGGALIMIGLQTRLAAFICSGTMAVAYFQFHWQFKFDNTFFPIVNQGEMAALYCFVFLYIATKGVGKWGLDKA